MVGESESPLREAGVAGLMSFQGFPYRVPNPSLPSPQPRAWEKVLAFLMKSRRTFWSSQLKVVKSSWCPVGKPPS